MWTREELKTNAKTVLKRYYWMAVAVCLIQSVLSGIITYIDNGMYMAKTMMDTISSIQAGVNYAAAVRNPFSLMWALGLVFIAVVGNPLLVGLCRYFMESRSRASDIGTLFYAFKNGRYLKVVKVMLIMDVKVLLWMLLFIVPGIIKNYEYCFIPYLLSENPDLETKRYFEISKAMTTDEKANIFVLDLSFFGWILLGALLCGIGTIFVTPYIQATGAELYSLMRAKALAFNFALPQELPDFLPQQFT